MSLLHNSKFIYEFDLKGFFDNVDLDFNYRMLWEELGYPKPEAAWFEVSI
jgi:retron-type reverse transcriptase